MPISQERELELEQELAAIVRKLERRPSVEKRGPKKPEAIQVPVGTILLDEWARAAATRPGAVPPPLNLTGPLRN